MAALLPHSHTHTLAHAVLLMLAIALTLMIPASASAAASAVPVSGIPEPAVMRQMWMTPVQTSSVLAQLTSTAATTHPTHSTTHHTMTGSIHTAPATSATDSASNTGANTSLVHLQNLATEYFEEFKKWHLENIQSNNVDKGATLSDIFFQYQRNDARSCRGEAKTGECEASISEQLKTIGSNIVIPAVRKFLLEMYVDTLLPPSPTFSSWISVHSNGSSHTLHHHKRSIVSAVLYLKTPVGSGELVFHDPRGSLPPFGKTLRIPPKIGDLVLFPGKRMFSIRLCVLYICVVRVVWAVSISIAEVRLSITLCACVQDGWVMK